MTGSISSSTIFAAYGAVLVVVPYILWRVSWIGEIAPLGILQTVIALLLGPTGLSIVAPDIGRLIVPSSLGAFDSAGWVAVMLFAFITGGHAELLAGARDAWRTLAVACTSFALPLIAGALLGLALYATQPSFVGANAARWTFATAIGICMAVTALPVLAIVIGDMGLHGSRLARRALATAATHDLALWIMLAAIIATAHGATTVSEAALVFALAIAQIATMLTVVRPLIDRLSKSADASDAAALTWSFGILAASGAIADAIGIHFALGAFLAGAAVPDRIFRRAARLLEPCCLFVLLPFFFLSVALKMPPVIEAGTFWGPFVIITAVAMVAKFVATAGSSYVLGSSPRESCALGALMQSKGLMEIVALTILLDARVISANCLPPFLAMAIVTTVACKPLTRVFLPKAAALSEIGAAAARSQS